MTVPNFSQLVEERRKALVKRAEKKYGPDALLPGGHPDRDVLDYLINELIGLPRYAEMVLARVRAHCSHRPNLVHRVEYMSRRISEEGQHLAFLVERLRWELIVHEEMELGKPENLGDDSHEK